MGEQLKKLLREVMRILKNPNLINDLEVKINKQDQEVEVLNQEVESLRNEKNSLLFTVQDLKEEICYFRELKEELLAQKKQISENINKIIDLAIADSELESQELYNRLKFIDPEGWCTYEASQKILEINVDREFCVESNMGRFEESDGHELRKYIEIAKFGDRTYKMISGMHEVLDKYTIEYNSNEYKEYLDKLYPLATSNLIKQLYKEEPSVKVKFLQQQMNYSSEETNEKTRSKVSKEFMKEKISNMEMDEELER